MDDSTGRWEREGWLIVEQRQAWNISSADARRDVYAVAITRVAFVFVIEMRVYDKSVRVRDVVIRQSIPFLLTCVYS